jgi:hypothetical protein
MKNPKQLIHSALLMLAWSCSAAASQSCLQEHSSTRLATLRINTCLLARAGAEDKPPIAVAIRQTVRNISAKPISMQVFDAPLWRAGIEIYVGSNPVSRPLPDPLAADEGEWPTFTYQRLEPGAEVQFEYQIDELLQKPPRKKTDYTIAINTRFQYRFLDEPEGKEYQLRHQEELLRNETVLPGWFFNVRLR